MLMYHYANKRINCFVIKNLRHPKYRDKKITICLFAVIRKVFEDIDDKNNKTDI